jgi:hypothetical protein
MAQQLYLAGQVTDKIVSVLKKYRVPSGTKVFMLLERQPQQATEQRLRQNPLLFTQLESDGKLNDAITRLESSNNPESYTSGRVFHPYGELRWEKQQQSVNVIYTGDEQYKPEIDFRETIQLSTCDVMSRRYFLFGKRLSGQQLERIGVKEQVSYFAEARIPRLLCYPAPLDAQRVQLLIYQYVDHDTGVNKAFRFVDLVGAE